MDLLGRNLRSHIEKLALHRGKMAFVSGPRQCGKTTLAKSLLEKHKSQYFSWDQVQFRRRWQKDPAEIATELIEKNSDRIVFDEIHKSPKWKNQLKGFYDTYGESFQILVTGSAHLNIFRKGADSLLGRYFHFNLHPFSLGEIANKQPMSFAELKTFLQSPEPSSSSVESRETLFKFGGFPEPFLAQSEEVHLIWGKSRIEALVRQDLKDISPMLNAGQIEILAAVLPDRVGSPLSIQSLREDLDVAHTTVTRWLEALSQVYFHFEIKPYSKSMPRSLKKEGKIYLYDWSQIEDHGARFENMVASHLKKMVDFYVNTGQANLSLHYLRDKEKREVDFLVMDGRLPLFTVEAKLTDLSLSNHFQAFRKMINVPHFQLCNRTDVFKKIKFADQQPASIMSFEDFFELLP